MASVRLYFPSNWFASVGVPKKARASAPYTRGRFIRRSASCSLEDRVVLPEEFLGRFEKEALVTELRPTGDGKVVKVRKRVTARPYVLPTDVRRHPLNRHLFTEAGELKPREDWGDPPENVAAGTSIDDRLPFADARSLPQVDEYVGNLAAQQAAEVERLTRLGEDPPKEDPTKALLEATEARFAKEKQEAEAGPADPSAADHDPHASPAGRGTSRRK